MFVGRPQTGNDEIVVDCDDADVDLDVLPAHIRDAARVEPNGEVAWRIETAPQAIAALTDAGKVVLGLDIRSYDSDGVTEVAWSAFDPRSSDDPIRDSRRAAEEALRRPEVPGDWVLVTWADKMSDDVIALVNSKFGDSAMEALAVLQSYDDASGTGTDRIRLALVTLSKGDIERLRYFRQRAHDDYRDVLMWAEHPPDANEPHSYTELREQLGLPPDPEHQ